jgi:hypothetical protein
MVPVFDKKGLMSGVCADGWPTILCGWTHQHGKGKSLIGFFEVSAGVCRGSSRAAYPALKDGGRL